MTLNNASFNDNMQLNVKKQLYLQDNLLCNGEFFHIRCCVHILNLIVQKGLKVASIFSERIKESIKYVKSLKVRMISFEGCVQKTKFDTNAYLVLNVPSLMELYLFKASKCFKVQTCICYVCFK